MDFFFRNLENETFEMAQRVPSKYAMAPAGAALDSTGVYLHFPI